MKDAVGIPVIGNGDVRTPEDAAAMVEATQLRCGDDWADGAEQSVDLSADCAVHGFEGGDGRWRYEQPTDQDRYRMIKTYFEMLVEEIASKKRRRLRGRRRSLLRGRWRGSSGIGIAWGR